MSDAVCSLLTAVAVNPQKDTALESCFLHGTWRPNEMPSEAQKLKVHLGTPTISTFNTGKWPWSSSMRPVEALQQVMDSC